MPPFLSPSKCPSSNCQHRGPSTGEMALWALLHRGPGTITAGYARPQGDWLAVTGWVADGVELNALLSAYPLATNVPEGVAQGAGSGSYFNTAPMHSANLLAAPGVKGVGLRLGLLTAVCMALVFLSLAVLEAAETPETVLIRQLLNAENFAHRRGDIDQMLSFYASSAAIYQGDAAMDPRKWSILHEQPAAFGQALAAEGPYQRVRTVAFVHVLEDRAFATTQDEASDRQGGIGQADPGRALWFLAKEQDVWKITGVVHFWAEWAGRPAASEPISPQIRALLQSESESWTQQQPEAVVDLYDKGFMALDGYGTVTPPTWKIVFAGHRAWGDWVRLRLLRAHYQIQRRIVYTHLGATGQKALAVSRDALTTTYKRGPATHQLNRYVVWFLSRQGDQWRISRLLYHIGPADE
ncbi:MAG: hypothetical protein GKR89_10530 [Candidatus Latescibacteria bacterium]|nr:hypothetical protein [Candidatus Latescibacterota bacterium]